MFYESVVVVKKESASKRLQDLYDREFNPKAAKESCQAEILRLDKIIKAVKESCQTEILRLDKIIKECDEKIAAAELPYMDFDTKIYETRSPIKVVPSGRLLSDPIKLAKSLQNCTYEVNADSLQELYDPLKNRVLGNIRCHENGFFIMTLLANPDGTPYELVPKPTPPPSVFGSF